MKTLNRRHFLRNTAIAGTAATFWANHFVLGQTPERKMKINLICGALGVEADQRQAIEYAAEYGFESVEAYPDFLAGLSDSQLQALKANLERKGLAWGSAGLPVEFRKDESTFQEGMKDLPRLAAGLRRAGVDRVNTWLMPCHAELTYLQNFKQHVRRLKEVAAVFQDHGRRLGFEYVGTATLRNSRKFPFIHTLAETRELVAAIGTGNVGFVLDSWHWWQADDTPEDILQLKNEQIILVDINDAPQGIPKNEQVDGRRELPATTGVIDIGAFLGALNRIGYDGPVRAEPFNQKLRDLDDAAALRATITAIKNALALIK